MRLIYREVNAKRLANMLTGEVVHSIDNTKSNGFWCKRGLLSQALDGIDALCTLNGAQCIPNTPREKATLWW